MGLNMGLNMVLMRRIAMESHIKGAIDDVAGRIIGAVSGNNELQGERQIRRLAVRSQYTNGEPVDSLLKCSDYQSGGDVGRRGGVELPAGCLVVRP